MDLSTIPRSVRWRIQLGVYNAVDTTGVVDTASTAQLLNLIYETNKEVIQKHHERFQSLVEKYVEVEIPAEEAVSPANETHLQLPDVDPLTAMLMEQQALETRKAELLLKYKKERARRKRGLTTEGRQIGDESDGIDQASLVIIEKDLKRLPHPTSNNGAASGTLSPDDDLRITHLKEILYIYAQEHPNMGYRQGMHEIASYFLWCLELEQKVFPGNPLFESLLPACFSLLEQTLEQLHLAYDASGEQSLQRMSQSILSKIHQNDVLLYKHLTTSPHIPPPPIYCTRWVRLLFSREVVGFDNVFQLWDVFFEYEQNVMRALEVTSAARILLLRDALLNPENSPLDLLMNVPPLQDTTPLTTLLKQLMDQKDSDQPIAIPSSYTGIPQTPAKLTGSPSIFATPQHHPLLPMPQPILTESLMPPIVNGNSSNTNNFSFSKMKLSLGQKGESIRKKIITATNEWKRESSSGSTLNSASSDVGATDATRQYNFHRNSTETALFHDPLLNPSSPLPPSPRKHQHARWSQGLKERILIVQNYLMTIESQEQQSSKVPAEVWEAMADMQRMQQELLNYSNNMS